MQTQPNRPRVPKYRKHKPTGQAVVTLNGRNHYLGRHGSAASRAKYDRLIAEWLAGGRVGRIEDEQSYTVAELIRDYWRHAQRHYVKHGEPTGEQSAIKQALKPLRQLYGDTQARDFGPLALKAVRQSMIDADHARSHVNKQIGRIRRMFKWGVENELVPADVVHGLQSVPGLRKGRSEARESDPVKPVPDAFVDAIEGHVARAAWATAHG